MKEGTRNKRHRKKNVGTKSKNQAQRIVFKWKWVLPEKNEKTLKKQKQKQKKINSVKKKKTEAKYTIVIQQAKNVSDRYEQNKARSKDDFE